ncbi:Por secretion system C-terminal sorting domain-containing protein [Catalinimonas alkaloidigena]|uniref:Por secretion system C-terminal sorting domain-containing protein n=1 Tax=Catalinimonas alkaloidigena TaxID=1075417 RepID=A0A1G9F0N9_9BACT|nr:PQQ-dependent sugar dehydrogenase [Catalinimonas alkaloidigena]SDK82016.1 Por secretion system C-terminal sorting domain-containing protein [Catalinimonas alkaloidigena]
MYRLFLLLLVLGCTPHAQAQYELRDAFPELTFDLPVDIVAVPGEEDRLAVVEKPGRIVVFANDAATSATQTLLDITPQVNSSPNEAGLLGLAFHPDFATNGYFYVNYTTGNLATRISRFQAGAEGTAAASSETILITFPQPFENHNAGCLRFGPDSYLYIATGDGGSGGDPQNNGQNRKSILGKMLRIDVNQTEGERPYAIPADNPYAGNNEGFLPEIYAYGLRNPWKFYPDPETGTLWVADVGQNKIEEIDRVEKGGNYGWRLMEASACYNPSTCDTAGLNLRLPVWEYSHDQGDVSITGGMVYRGQAAPSLQGKYIYGDYVSGRIWSLDAVAVSDTSPFLLKMNGNISTFGLDAAGELYVANYRQGKLYQLVEVTPTPSRSSMTPLDFSVQPNPGGAAFQFTINTQATDKATLQLFDHQGRHVDTLFRNERVTPGTRQVDYAARHLPSGVYIAQLTTSSGLQTLRLVRQ